MNDVFLQKRVNSKSFSSLQGSRNSGSRTVNTALIQKGKPLSGSERAFFGSRFGYNFSDVRVHDDNYAFNAADEINAQAFTLGNDIVLGNSELGSPERKNLLAHELTHVVQQNKVNGIPDSSANTEKEADHNSRNISGNGGISINTASSSGKIQRKPKSKINIENSGTKKKKGDQPAKNENKYSFTAETKIPLPGSREYGKLSLLDNLNLKISGEKSGEEPISGPVDMETLKLKIALEMAKLELEKVKNTRFGKFSAGAKIGSDSSLALNFGKGSGFEGEAGASAGFSLGYKSPNLIPGRYGSLGAEANLGGTGSLTGTVSDEESKYTPKLSSKAGFGLKYSSPSFAGGPLGDRATFDVGVGAEVSGSLTPEKKGLKVGGSGEIGVTGKSSSGLERFVKVKITKDFTIDQNAGEARSYGGSVMIGGFVGANF